MAQVAFKASIGAARDPSGQWASKLDAQTTDALAAATTADNAVATVVTDLTAALADMDSFGAAVIAITGDTYSGHQFGGAATTGLTAAQCNTLFKTGTHPLNTAITDEVTAQTDTNTAKAATAAAKAGSFDTSQDVTIIINTTNITTMSQLQSVINTLLTTIAGSGNFKP